MNQEVFDKVQEVVRKILNNDSLLITRELTAFSVPGWDSLSHVRLIGAIEKAFSVKFRGSEIVALQNVGQLLDLVEKKLNK